MVVGVGGGASLQMTCLLTADLHYTLKQFDWVGLAAGKFDLVVLAGDLLDISSLVETETQVLVVMKYLRRIREQSRLLVSSGNHDGDERTPTGESVARWLAGARADGVLVDGDSYMSEGILFTVCPWWDGPATAEEVAALLARDAAKPREKWIWVYHAPPDQTRVSWTGKGHFGDAQLAGWIRQYRPEMVLSGHVHQSPFRNGGGWLDRLEDTWLFNAGRQIGPEPAFVVLDLAAWTAAWCSQAGRSFVDLRQPWDPGKTPAVE